MGDNYEIFENNNFLLYSDIYYFLASRVTSDWIHAGAGIYLRNNGYIFPDSCLFEI